MESYVSATRTSCRTLLLELASLRIMGLQDEMI